MPPPNVGKGLSALAKDPKRTGFNLGHDQKKTQLATKFPEGPAAPALDVSDFGLESTHISSPLPQLMDPPNKTGSPGKGPTDGGNQGFSAAKTMVRGQGPSTHELPKAGPTMSQDGGPSQNIVQPASAEISRQGAEQNQITPWDRPALDSMPPLQWAPDDHFISSL